MCDPVGLYLLVFSYDFIKAGKGDKSLKSALACSYGMGAIICSQSHYTYTDGPGCVTLMLFASFDFSIPFPDSPFPL